MLSSDEIAAFIRTRLALTEVPGLPEIRLHRAGPGSGLWRLADMDECFGTPYWAYEWGGGLALAQYIAEMPGSVAGLRVLDLGSGSGIVAITAARAGAAHVIAADVDPYAGIAAMLNAEANSVAIETWRDDLLGKPPLPVDVVLVADLFYEPKLAARVLACLKRCRQKGIDVLVGDPGRACLPLDQLQQVAAYPGGDFGIGESGGVNSVYRLKADE